MVAGRDGMGQDDPVNYAVWFVVRVEEGPPEGNILVRCCLPSSLTFGRTARDETVMRPASSLDLSRGKPHCDA